MSKLLAALIGVAFFSGCVHKVVVYRPDELDVPAYRLPTYEDEAPVDNRGTATIQAGRIRLAADEWESRRGVFDMTGSSSGTNTGDVTLAAFGSTPNANGLTLVAQVLNMQPADATNPGGVSTTTQSFLGAKTFLTSASSPTLFGTTSLAVGSGTTPVGVVNILSAVNGTSAPSVWGGGDVIIGGTTTTSAALGIHWDSTNDRAQITVLQPGTAWKELRIRAVRTIFTDNGATPAEGAQIDGVNGQIRLGGASSTFEKGVRSSTGTAWDVGSSTTQCVYSSDVAVTGAAFGDTCSVASADDLSVENGEYGCVIASAGQINFRFCTPGTAVDPASHTLTARVSRY